MLKRIGAEEGGEFKAVASGTLPSGRPVIVNADGTVSVVAETVVSEALGSATSFESGALTGHMASTYDTNSNRVVIYYKDDDNSDYPTAVVGTVGSNNSLSFGTPVVTISNNSDYMSALFDSSNNKVVLSSQNNTGSGAGDAIVGTVDPSDNSISFGTKASMPDTGNKTFMSSVFDSTNNKCVFAFKDGSSSNRGKACVGTVSGTSISFGSNATFLNTTGNGPESMAMAFDSANGKVVLVFFDRNASNKLKGIVGTVSGTSISFGSETEIPSAGAEIANDCDITYDPDNGKLICIYRATSASNVGRYSVGTVSGTSVTFAASTAFTNYNVGSSAGGCSITYDTTGNVILIAAEDGTADIGKLYTATLDADGETLTFSGVASGVVQTSPTTYGSNAPRIIGSLSFAPDVGKVVIPFANQSWASQAIAVQPGYTSQNLTSENYIGMSRGVAFQSPIAEGVGSAVQYKAASFAYGPLVFDSNANKTVFAYPDAGDSNKGKAKVATVSGTSISFGSEATFTTNHCNQLESVFDSSNNKVVIVYRDQDNSSYGTAVVGTVSGTSITFGSPVVFNSANSFWFGVAFDSTNNKIVIAYRDVGNSSYGTAIVGTVSGTSMSFGSETTFESATSVRNQLVYDTTNQKIVLAYINGSTSGPLQSRVGTVSGTSISFGSEVTIDSDTCFEPQLVFNPDTGTVIVIYYNSTDGNGTSKIGTVSGTSISFSSETVFNSGGTSDMDVVYDSNAQKIVVTYKKSDADGFLKVGTVGASSISYGTELEFADYDISYTNSAFDSNLNKVVIGYADLSNSNYGTAIVFQNTGTETIRGQITNGQAASIDIIGSVSDNQLSLTAGQQYFVQNDGTISTTADSPSVLAGTAISATELVVKT